MHRDSLGSAVPIRPGEVNWMTAGRGIVHSERTGAERRAAGGDLHGLQCWVALPETQEEMAPGFAHYDKDFPVIREADKSARIVVGSLYGKSSPVITTSDTIFADITLKAGGTLPLDADHEERAIYMLDGEIEIGGDRFSRERLLVF